ncbi:MAG: VOC family protein, partial [Pseudanabaenales cyanobacterium]|nr:VOC family protein [Pseudanabaenales cyanobacterium]
MGIQSTKVVKHTLLSVLTATAIALGDQSPATSLSDRAIPQPKVGTGLIQTSQDKTYLFQPNLTLSIAQTVPAAAQVQAVATVGMTVSDMDQAIAFYSEVLPFRKISDVEVWGREYEL